MAGFSKAPTLFVLACCLTTAGVASVASLPDGQLSGLAWLLVPLAALVVAPLVPATYNAARPKAGSAAAWGWLAIAPVSIQALLCVHLLGLSNLFGLTECDPMASPCNTARPPEYWLPIALFMCCAAASLAALRTCKVADRHSTIRLEREIGPRVRP